MMNRLLVMILSRWVRIMRFWSMMTGMITWFGMVIPGFGVGRFGGSGITFSTLAIHSSGMVTSSQIFIENSPIATVKGVLFAISMAVMVNLTSRRDQHNDGQDRVLYDNQRLCKYHAW